ncbi:laccase [Mycena rosella]|uniref:Laccase n=1 Tax=Mycena rosella TaxID=1033263 RepID=A0AAD7CSH3_MYCRO|nr:laccase [Mycena rosella]
MMLSAAFLFLSTLLGTYAAVGPVANIEVINKVISPDGVSRSAVLVDGVFPGPLISGKKGDHFLLNVVDKLTDNKMLTDTTIHWHGIVQTNTNYADGAGWITQCPISAGHSFLYDFHVPDQAGTFWYHSHISTQYCDGLRGPFVVYDPNDPAKHLYDVDDESTVITLADWYQYNSFDSPITPSSALAVINVSRGKRYRFRLVSMSCLPSFVFNVDGHSMTIIEADGVSLQPVVIDSLEIFAGQRYSFVLTANQPVSNYWVRAQPILGGPQGFDNGINSAILRYAGAPKHEPTSDCGESRYPLVETSLHPLVPSKVPGKHVPGGADVNLELDIAFNFTGGVFLINNQVTFHPPPVPVLLQILSGAQSAQDLLPEGQVYALPANKVIEVVIPGGSAGFPHPFHLHGHNFHVVRSAGNSTYNWNNPIVRDVVSTGNSTDDLVTFRFVTDNAGPWFLHCHIDWHLEIGLAAVFVEDIPRLSHENPPVGWDQLCAINAEVSKNTPGKQCSPLQQLAGACFEF